MYHLKSNVFLLLIKLKGFNLIGALSSANPFGDSYENLQSPGLFGLLPFVALRCGDAGFFRSLFEDIYFPSILSLYDFYVSIIV